MILLNICIYTKYVLHIYGSGVIRNFFWERIDTFSLQYHEGLSFLYSLLAKNTHSVILQNYTINKKPNVWLGIYFLVNR